MAIKKFRLKNGKFFYHDKDGVLKQGAIGEIFEREESHVSYDMFEVVNDIVKTEAEPILVTTESEPEDVKVKESDEDVVEPERHLFGKKHRKR